MKKINFLLILIFLILSACGNAGKILRNEKIKTTDEFLVEKKKPLILPPDLDQIPEPGTKVEKTEEKDVLKEILKKDTKKNKTSGKSSSIEESIIKRLPK